jgi:3-phenylpropionate/trans-cinnamate dioxygenase ferredoxin subunit
MFVDAGPADLAPGAVEARRAGGHDILLARAEDGQYHAVAAVCSHAGLPLSAGRVRGSSIVCPHHGARFCLKTGRALGAPAFAPIAAYPTRLAGARVEVWPL